MNTRKDKNGVANSASAQQWRALGVAKIMKPLRFIKARCAVELTNMKGEKETHYTQPYPRMRHLANAGQGRAVQSMALFIQNT